MYSDAFCGCLYHHTRLSLPFEHQSSNIMDAVRSVARQDAYVLEMDEGESWTIPGTNSSLRELTLESLLCCSI